MPKQRIAFLTYAKGEHGAAAMKAANGCSVSALTDNLQGCPGQKSARARANLPNIDMHGAPHVPTPSTLQVAGLSPSGAEPLRLEFRHPVKLRQYFLNRRAVAYKHAVAQDRACCGQVCASDSCREQQSLRALLYRVLACSSAGLREVLEALPALQLTAAAPSAAVPKRPSALMVPQARRRGGYPYHPCVHRILSTRHQGQGRAGGGGAVRGSNISGLCCQADCWQQCWDACLAVTKSGRQRLCTSAPRDARSQLVGKCGKKSRARAHTHTHTHRHTQTHTRFPAGMGTWKS